jgi:cell division protein ZapA (FtsZ GTPase activity inhibitor)
MKDEGMKTRIEVEIFGQTFTVTSEDDAQYVRALVSHVDQRMRQIEGNTKTAVPLRVAIMAALSIADEYHKAVQREAEIHREAERLSSLLLARIEQSEKRDGLSHTESPLKAFTAAGSTATPEGGAKKEALPPS